MPLGIETPFQLSVVLYGAVLVPALRTTNFTGRYFAFRFAVGRGPDEEASLDGPSEGPTCPLDNTQGRRSASSNPHTVIWASLRPAWADLCPERRGKRCGNIRV
jgi:hypothetical protein